MSNKWRTGIEDLGWVKEAYNDDPQNPSAKILVRSIYGLSRTISTALIDTLNATKSVSNPYADGIPITGTFRVIKNECRQSSSSNSLAGSDVITQTLGQGFFGNLSASNKFVMKNIWETEEQNENGWMYYEWGIVRETSRWVNISSSSIGGLFPYLTNVEFETPLNTPYEFPIFGDALIEKCWYEKEQDGSYSIYRTIFARSTTANVRYRTRQNSGAIYFYAQPSAPINPYSIYYLNGFRFETLTLYAGSKFVLDGNTYVMIQDRPIHDIYTGTGPVAISHGSTGWYCSPGVSDETIAKLDPMFGGTLPVYFASVS